MAYSARLKEAVLRNPTAPAAELAAELGVTTHAIHCVRHELRKAGHDIPYAGTRAGTSTVKAFIAKNPKATPEEVSRATGCSVGYAENMAREARRERFESEANAVKERSSRKEYLSTGENATAFVSMIRGFSSKIRLFMQTTEISKKTALAILDRGIKEMKEAITNGT